MYLNDRPCKFISLLAHDALPLRQELSILRHPFFDLLALQGRYFLVGHGGGGHKVPAICPAEIVH